MFDFSFDDRSVSFHVGDYEDDSIFVRFGSAPHRVDPNAGAAPRSLPNHLMALGRLRQLRRYTHGWDGPGSGAASPISFDLCEKFLGLLGSLSPTFQVDAMIYSPGTAVLSITSQDVSARLEFMASGEIAANIDNVDGEHDIDLDSFDGTRIPVDLVEFLDPRRATSKCIAA